MKYYTERNSFVNMKNSRNPMLKFLIIGLCLSFMTQGFSQVFGPQEFKWIRVGDLRSFYSNAGAEIEFCRFTSAVSETQNDGLRYPAQFTFQDHSVAKSLRIGATNYADAVSGETYAHKVVSAGTRTAYMETELMPYEFSLTGKFPSPLVVVDGLTGSNNFIQDILDDVDADQAPDRIIENNLHTSMGVDVKRKILGFSQENHDNYMIYEYVFKNTGVIDSDGTLNTQTLNDVMFHFQYRYGFAFEAFRNGWVTSASASWGRNTVNHTVWEDPTNGDPIRAQYSWYGPVSPSPGYAADIGAPNHTGGAVMAGTQYVGIVTLHADTAPGDQTNDTNQPTTTMYLGSDRDAQGVNQYSADLMTRKYEFMTAGHPELTHAEQVDNGFADVWGIDAGGYAQGQGFGPYTLNPGDSIRIVLAEAIAGISREKNLEVTANWNDESGSYELPDGSTTSDANTYKNAWVQSGVDSLFQTFRMAKLCFENDYVIPQPPPPPTTFTVNSGGDRIILEWSNESATAPGFDGFAIYRAMNRADTIYTKIWECDAANVAYTYSDETPARGFDYYYYIVAKNDGSANDLYPGLPMESSKHFTMTSVAANLKRPAGENLEDIRVVPNPFDIRSRALQFGEENNLVDRITFFDIPPLCNIMIYTERGDLIEKISHTNGTGDEYWHSITSARQLVVSGVYIAVFEVTEDYRDPDTQELLFSKGESTYRKFTIIR